MDQERLPASDTYPESSLAELDQSGGFKLYDLMGYRKQKSRRDLQCCLPNPVPLKDFYEILAEQIKYKGIKIPSPLFLMKLAGGEMAKNLLISSKALPEKALSQDFVFQYPSLEHMVIEGRKACL